MELSEVLEVQFEGWTATPRLPFVLSGNAVCMPTPTYSLLLGVIGCCLGRIVSHTEVDFGFHYRYWNTAYDMEKRQRLEHDGRKVKPHAKGSDVHNREFHVISAPGPDGNLQSCLTLWLNRTDWADYFRYPVGTPALGRSQDLLTVRKKSVRIVPVRPIEEAALSGCLLPFGSGLPAAGQLVQLAEAYEEDERIGGGRRPVNPKIFVSVPDNAQPITLRLDNLYQTEEGSNFYLHTWQ